MGVDRLESGSYRARLMVDGQTYTATFPTKKEAREWLVVTRGRVAGAQAARRVTVEQYARQWLGEFIDTAPDVDRYRRDVTEAIGPLLGSRGLAEVAPVDIDALLEQVNLDPSPAVVDQVWETLQELFADALDDGIIERSPVPVSRRAASGQRNRETC